MGNGVRYGVGRLRAAFPPFGFYCGLLFGWLVGVSVAEREGHVDVLDEYWMAECYACCALIVQSWRVSG